MTSSATPPPDPGARLDRRRFLVIGGGAMLLAACSTDDAPTSGAGDATSSIPGSIPGSTASPSSEAPAATATDTDSGATDEASETSGTSDASGGVAPFGAADFEALGVCALLADTAAGPFPNIEQLDRRDVTEGLPGHPVRLGLRVIDAACEPLPGAAVEIWHTDATGDYSSYTDNGGGKDEGSGSTFMRGIQTAGDDGVVEFDTIYPGWYPGRAVHIHLRVHLDGRELLTSQLFFDDGYTEQIYTAAPYDEFGPPDTSNTDDRIAGAALTTGGLLHSMAGPTRAGEGTVALTNLGVTI